MTLTAYTRDGFLNGRVLADQPRKGFRAGHDTVLLAAGIPARSGERLLELGSGTGIASLCVAARVANCEITGIEIDPELVALANANAALNQMSARLVFAAGDAGTVAFPAGFFDHVFFNPPFHRSTGQPARTPARDRAVRDPGDAPEAWTRAAISCVRQGGTVSAILCADRHEQWRASLSGAVIARPLVPRAGQDPKRMIVRLYPGKPASFTMVKPLVLHESDGAPTEAAEAVLRHGAALAMS